MFDLDEIDAYRDDFAGITDEQEHALELELLARLIVAGGTATLAKLFDNYRQPWMIAACERLEDGGLIEVLGEKRLRATEAGQVEYERSRSW